MKKTQLKIIKKTKPEDKKESVQFIVWLKTGKPLP